jgi:GNAT superfamily N-acetyltransferase
VIREFRPEDAARVSAILHEEEVPHAVTPAGVLHWLEAQPERAHPRMFVAEKNQEIVGWAESRLNWAVKKPGVADLWAYVRPRERGRGIGRALYEAAESHLRGIGARVLQTWTYSPAGLRLLENRGFRATGRERISKLDLTDADLSRLPALEESKAAEGFRLVTLGKAIGDLEALHRVYTAAAADVPEYFTEDDVRLEEWSRETLDHPQLAHDGSFVVLSGVQPVALAFLEIDEPAGLAANEMTGTLPEFRRRGLARLAKLATIRWAAHQGISRILTGNAEANVGMLRLNESLGYRPLQTETHFVREPD